MHLEKINKNKIKCTLSEQDLRARNLNLSELAYGSEKAKQLFAEMLDHANTDLDFNAEDVPITIEAIPLSRDSLILIITKIETTDELDTRFSRFSIPDDEASDEEEILEFGEDVLPLINIDDYLSKDASSEPSGETSKTVIYSFHDLDTLIELSIRIGGYYNGINSLYKDTLRGIYYLVLHQSYHLDDEFENTCRLASEFGTIVNGSDLTEAYYREHLSCIAEQTALQRLLLF